MMRHLSFCCGLLLFCAPASAVVILDSTWARNGGTRATPANGFRAAIALAQQPQFRGLVALSGDGGETWGDCSGVWIGNDRRHGYVLTAAHCFDAEHPPETFLARTQGGTTLRVIDSVTHEKWVDVDTSLGYDLAILTLASPVRDAGNAPSLYGGRNERGKLLTFMGYGKRGIASVGEGEQFHDGRVLPAAAQGVIDRVNEQKKYFGIFFPAEDGSVPNPDGGPNRPITPLVGSLASGDSGGPAWIQVGSTWAVAGVNSSSTGKSGTGDFSNFVRVSGNQAWIQRHAPVARFIR